MYNLKHIVESHMRAGKNRMMVNLRMPIMLSKEGNKFRGRAELKLTGVDIAVFADLNSQLNKKRIWGNHIAGPFVRHEGTVHIECLCLTIHKIEYLVDGKVVTPQSISGMPPMYVDFFKQSKPRIRYFSTVDITKVEAGDIMREHLYMQI